MSLSKIIKSVSTKQNIRPIEHRNIEKRPSALLEIPIELQQLSQDIINEANEKASVILQDMTERKETFEHEMELREQEFENEKFQVLESIKAEGYQEGFEEGKNEATKSFQEKLNLANQVVETAHEDYHRYLEQAENEILELALSISHKIIDSELEETPDKWINLVKKAIRQVREQDPIKVIISPGKYELVTNHRDEIEAVTHHHRVLIIPDEQLTDSNCLIETPFGRIEAGIDNQLKMIRTKLFELMEEHSDEGL